MPKINHALDSVHRTPLSYQSTEKIRLHASERDKNFSNLIWSKFIQSLSDTDVRYYPNIVHGYNVLEKIAGIDNRFLTLCDGSDTCLRNIFLTFGPLGTEVVTTLPSFPMYEIYANMFGCKPVLVSYNDARFPFEKFINAITDNTSIVILSNPSSPVGDTLTQQQIKQLLSRCKKANALLAIDEAYIEFSNTETSAYTAINDDNLIVIRTLSKAFGSAGVRVGYVISSKYNKQLLHKVKANNEISSFAIKWLETLAEHLTEIKTYIANVKDNRDDLILHLQTHKIDVLPSQTNFIHVKYVGEYENIVTKKCNLPWSSDYYHRISIPGSVASYTILKKQIC
jgi:histidinol-phosphate aminotransferase